MPELLDNPDFGPARRWFEKSCKASRDHADLAAKALSEYGDHGPDVSGCVRSHFPDDIKSELRTLAGQVSYCSALAHSYRPKRVHKTTMRRLAGMVAARDGSGFYGPQPMRLES